FIESVLRLELGVAPPARVLDLGCGSGGLVAALAERGYEAHGCDVVVSWDDDHGRLAPIQTNPYHLPYADANFDAVISTSALELARTKTELFAEVHRVLRPGGATSHVYPSKYYLPAEPHIHVPLVSWLWPRVPRVWLAIWALAGVRNEFQRGMPWREVV